MILEALCRTPEDVLAAQAAGADRIELCQASPLGGLTPSAGLLKTCKRMSPLPIFAMVRPREGGFCYRAGEYEAMLAEAELLMEAGADGLVFGILTDNGIIDRKRSASLLARTGTLPATFHRAFDRLDNQREAVDILADLGFRRILTSGGKATALEGADQIKNIVDYAQDRLAILAGGGVRADNAANIVKTTGVSEIHTGVSRYASSKQPIKGPKMGTHDDNSGSYLVLDQEELARIRRDVDGAV